MPVFLFKYAMASSVWYIPLNGEKWNSLDKLVITAEATVEDGEDFVEELDPPINHFRNIAK